ncbi:hypothetical protein A3K63_04040 [Candidatus Micrarchaeota archaeon RBG_16_49_10]|nr:MAG: hypothetical protein A3K63_04040 [Candidatus Micrarchaeota archaeon RBG_16_49_10]
MIIAATADIHAPLGFRTFVRSLDNLKVEPDLFLIAGDLIHKGQVGEMKKISNALFGRISCPIVCCFGNNEYVTQRDEIVKEFKNFAFLEDEIFEAKIKEKNVSILGTQGSLDRPTPWQRSNFPDIENVYRERIALISDFLASTKADFKILLIHYPPTYKVMRDEDSTNFQYLGTNKLEDILIEGKPNIVVTGHVHSGKRMAWVDSIPVFNVGLKLNQGIVVINTEELKPGLGKFLT